ncbi:hypothetical protein PAXRUDRAFT_148542 [Paxillus rubicundulus Ve08.2h10]|uniref:Uncharacterized protein n=1 Tax=Paxillus rubicundulus Ve08.2h10 TaxID=930991 RepID=A0A0D0DYR2_9AGAM|nr:hypothetical protein PAXRUDRAFT_148542 [Paxillus rubicundulus Ve08.2h10]
MPPLIQNPNHAVQPDFTLEEHTPACQQLTDNGIPDAQATIILTNLWIQSNDKEKTAWARRIEEEALAEEEADRCEAQEATEHQQEQDEEEAKALQEERHKNKSKFVPPVILPSQISLHKLKSRAFCELWYFTNNGLADAETSGSSALDDNHLTLSQTPDGLPSFIPAIFAKDYKAPIVQDENLTWEQFREAALCMIDAMCDHEWNEDCITMHIKFWTALENHPWRHSCLEYSKCTLLHYQGQQRHCWHHLVSTPKAFSLAELEQQLLDQTREHLMHQDKTNEIKQLKQVHTYI